MKPKITLRLIGISVFCMSEPWRIWMLEAGIAAPPFTLLDQDAKEVSLGDYAGQWVLLWWYPKAATPG
jgi:peroxiredoxin Q/BCP